MKTKKFQRTTEDFICGNCGHQVQGSGYTNHCPKCLWSQHVDVNPGDRSADCGGLMKPIEVFQKHNHYYIKQRCVKCDHERNNKASPNDNFDVLVTLSNQ